MESPEIVSDIYLNPGEYAFGNSGTRIRTLLGSCISIILWNQKFLYGGMCHYVLPTRGMVVSPNDFSGKYADEVFQLLLNCIQKKNLNTKDFTARIFGGANMLEKQFKNELQNFKNAAQVGSRNIEIAYALCKDAGIEVISEDIGGDAHRRIYFSVWDGEIWMDGGNT